MNTADIMAVLLLSLLLLAVSLGTSMVFLLVRHARRRGFGNSKSQKPVAAVSLRRRSFVARPMCWLAVRSRNPQAVQSALALHHVKPCSWLQGLAGEAKLFVAPPVKGWILVFGSGLPEPQEDVDACYRFVVELSRRLGHVQLFSASRILHHHAWVRADSGRIIRAYAWAGRALWVQGQRTSAEKELGVACLEYTDLPDEKFGLPDRIAANVDKVPMLAARWSLDPAAIDERSLEHECGIAGEPSHRY